MKKGLLLTFSLVLIIGVIYKLTSPSEEWQTFKKTAHNEIQSYPTTTEEKKRVKISSQKEEKPQKRKERLPASKRTSNVISSGRKEVTLPGQKWKDKAKPLNKPHKDWKKRMGNDLLRFLRPETKLFVRQLESLTINNKGNPHHVEKVLVKLSSPEGKLYSYNALVDSESGKLIKTWNRTIHENIALKDHHDHDDHTPQGKFRPSGAITKQGSIRY